MPDLYHDIGSDLVVSANGDLLTAASVILSQQSVLRRLLTNPTIYDSAGNVVTPGDYLWHPDYGAGLRKMIGRPYTVAGIQSLITAQMFLEASVSRTPAPTVSVTSIPNGVSVDIQYIEVDSQLPATLTFPVTQ